MQRRSPSTIYDAAREREELSSKLGQLLSLASPTQLEHYRIVSMLGRGGMGEVYRAVDERTGKEVALKLLRGESGRARSRARLAREAAAIARLSHPNVVGLHELGDAEGLPFLAMELVEGVDLGVWLGRREPRSLSSVLSIFIQAGRGLAAAHRAGLVHSDFKPSNVLVGNDGRARVSDFGLARARGTQRPPARLERVELPGVDPDGTWTSTVTGTVTGTPAYMAPEQFTGGTIDERTDQFSFCVALWQAVYGQRPFRGATLEDLAEDVLAGRPQGGCSAGVRVPRWLRRALERGLAVEPSQRWPSLDALISVLERRRWLVRSVGRVPSIGRWRRAHLPA